MKRRGKALLLIVVLIPLVAMVLQALAQMLILDQVAVRHNETQSQARLMAEAGISTAVARIRREPEFGRGGESLVEKMGHAQDSEAGFALTFDASAANSSVNNFRRDVGSRTADGRICPSNSLLLRSYGRFRGETVVVEALLSIPPYPYALASAGKIHSRNGMVLGSVPPDFDPAKGLNEAQLTPAELMANSYADDALVLRKATIVGNAKSAGGVDKDESVVVKQGELVAHARKEDVPVIDLSAIDFDANEFTTRLSQDVFSDKAELSGLVQWQGGTLRFSRGLHLNGATVRIKGNVVIEGGIKGTGALLVDGNVTVNGCSELAADNECAIVAQGSVAMKGPGYYQGLVYAGGADGISLKDCTVIGTVLNAGKAPDGTGAPMEVERATVAFQSKAVSTEFELGWSGNATIRVGNRFGSSGTLQLREQTLSDGSKGIPTPAWFAQQGRTSLQTSDFDLVLADGTKGDANAVEVAFQASGRQIQALTQDIALAASSGGTVLEKGRFHLDLNRFLKTSDRLRIVRIRLI